MKRLLLITAALLALTGGMALAAEPGGRTQLFDEDGNHIGVSVESGNKLTIHYDNGKVATDEFYCLNGKLVSVFTDEEGGIEVRWVRQPADHITGLLFGSDAGPWQLERDGFVKGNARLDRLTGRRGCDYDATLYRTSNGGLVIGANKSWKMAKCRVVLRPDFQSCGALNNPASLLRGSCAAGGRDQSSSAC
jgi:hypothetical protein